MTNILRALLAALLFPAAALASPYFRVVSRDNFNPIAGALLAPQGLKQTEGATLLPLITHDPLDGCLLPSIICEDWAPLAVGGALNAGHLMFEVAPLANVLPWVQSAALAAIPESYPSVRAFFTPPVGTPPTTFSAGPVWEYQERTNKGYFKIFTGLALHF